MPSFRTQLQLLEKCLFHGWNELKAGRQGRFHEVEAAFRICLLGWLHGRRNLQIKQNEPTGSKWQNLTAVFAKAIKPTHDDLGDSSFSSSVGGLLAMLYGEVV